jgi:hypothetical protein
MACPIPHSLKKALFEITGKWPSKLPMPNVLLALSGEELVQMLNRLNRKAAKLQKVFAEIISRPQPGPDADNEELMRYLSGRFEASINQMVISIRFQVIVAFLEHKGFRGNYTFQDSSPIVLPVICTPPYEEYQRPSRRTRRPNCNCELCAK